MEDNFRPPGFRFFPTEVELLTFYLKNKLDGLRPDLNEMIDRVIPVLDIYEFHPWDLPQLSGDWCREDPEQWFFFVPRHEREVRGGRPNRLTSAGYWKATGSPGFVHSASDSCVIGVKKTMVFYEGRAPNGTKTEWKMNEYKAIQNGVAFSASMGDNRLVRYECSLCRVYKKSENLRAFDRRPSGHVTATVEERGTGISEPSVMNHYLSGYNQLGRSERVTRSEENPRPNIGGQLLGEGDIPVAGNVTCSRSNALMVAENDGTLMDWDQLDVGFDF